MTATAAVFGERYFFETLGTVYVGPVKIGTGRNTYSSAIREMAKFQVAVDNCLNSLEQFYRTLPFAAQSIAKPLQPPGSRSTSRTENVATDDLSAGAIFPQWTCFTVNGMEFSLTYKQRLTRHFDRTVFLATMMVEGSVTGSSSESVVVKFCDTYSKDAQQLLANHNLAPTLHYCGFEHSLDMWVVAMQHVHHQNSDYSGDNPLVSSDDTESLKSAINLLHDHGLVHGDLRWPNVLLRKPKGVCVIDFEWAGLGGEVFYPTDVSRELD